MVKKITTIAMAMAFLASFSSTASAALITDAGVVGVISGQPFEPVEANEKAAAQYLLNMLASTTDLDGPGGVAAGANTCNYLNVVPNCWATSATEFSGTITSDGAKSATGDFTVNAGYEYVMAKYDGPQGGYVLFYVGGNAVTLPQYSFPLWGGNSTQYGMSHHTAFNAVTTGGQCFGCTSVPDGGSTLLMLGAALGGFGVVRRRFIA